MVDLTVVSLERRAARAGEPETFAVAGARRAVASWSGAVRHVEASLRYRESGAAERLLLADVRGPGVPRLRSQTLEGERATLAFDELRANVALESVTIEAGGEPETFAVAASSRASGTPAPPRSRPRPGARVSLDVAARSQYGAARLPIADEAFARTTSGWCAPASLAMLLDFHGTRLETHDVAAAVYDPAFGGTGNWSFGTSFAARFGFGAVAYLRDLAHARAFVEAGFPLGLSFRWRDGQLPGAPLPRSAGHLAVLRGFDAAGDPVFADPAQPALVATYDYATFEAVWQGHGGVAFLVGPERDANRLIALANGAGAAA